MSKSLITSEFSNTLGIFKEFAKKYEQIVTRNSWYSYLLVGRIESPHNNSSMLNVSQAIEECMKLLDNLTHEKSIKKALKKLAINLDFILKTIHFANYEISFMILLSEIDEIIHNEMDPTTRRMLMEHQRQIAMMCKNGEPLPKIRKSDDGRYHLESRNGTAIIS